MQKIPKQLPPTTESSQGTIPEDTNLPTDSSDGENSGDTSDSEEEENTEGNESKVDELEDDPEKVSQTPMKTPGNMVTYNTPTPAVSKMLEMQQKEPVTE